VGGIPISFHASRFEVQVSSNPFPQGEQLEPKHLVGGLWIPDIVFLQHEELIAADGGWLSQQALADEFQEQCLATGEAKRHLDFHSPALQDVHNLVHDLR
jgi:hypothetical protein